MQKLLFSLLLMMACGTALAQQAAEELVRLLAPVRSFQANFVQSVIDAKGNRLQDALGEIKVKRPNLFYWKTDPPLEQVIVSDGREIWIYDPDLEQVTVKPLQEDIQNTPALLLSGEVKDLEKSYRIERIPAQGERKQFRLVPKGNDSLFELLVLLFQDEHLVEMRLLDSLGQSTLISFANVRLNEEIPAATFEFQIPPGVDLFREE